jgi:hypothetical protein
VALLHGKGLISIPEAAGAMGMSGNTLFSELRNAGAELFNQTTQWQDWSVADIWDVERDYDDSFVLNDVKRMNALGIKAPMGGAWLLSQLHSPLELSGAADLISTRRTDQCPPSSCCGTSRS